MCDAHDDDLPTQEDGLMQSQQAYDGYAGCDAHSLPQGGASKSCIEPPEPQTVLGHVWTEQERATKRAVFIRLCEVRPCEDKWNYGLRACNECWQMRIAFGPQ